jgi:diacylglycerol O-acyltransferase / wax synthase
MERLTTLDAAFLEAEDSDRHVSLAIGGLSILEGPIPDQSAILDAVSERLLPVPRFTQVVRTYPFGLAAPEWVDDPNFSVLRHVRRAAVPHPGDDRALFRLVADAMERRLDRDRPLWECWIIEGLEDDRWAILIKLHHCIADGIAATQMLACLSDEGGGDTFVDRIRAAKDPSPRGIRLPDLTLNPMNWISGMWRTSVALTAAATQAVEGAIEIASGPLSTTTSSLTGRVTGMRRYATTHVPLKDVAQVCQAFDVTINDVALAAITDSYRAAMIRRGEKPRRDSLRTLVPVSVRSNDAMDKIDNRVSVMLPHLPVEEYDPVRQLHIVHKRLTRAKGNGQRQAASLFVSAANVIPFVLAAWTMRAVTRLPQRRVVTVATNVPGPRRQLRMMGRRVVRLMPIPPIALGLRTGIAILSYADDLVFGITVDYDAAPDVDELANGIERAVERLAAISADKRILAPVGE